VDLGMDKDIQASSEAKAGEQDSGTDANRVLKRVTVG
jgi:hypothetical protein